MVVYFATINSSKPTQVVCCTTRTGTENLLWPDNDPNVTSCTTGTWQSQQNFECRL